MSKVNIAEKFSKITEFWKPYIGAELNGQCVKFDKLKGEFVFHHHPAIAPNQSDEDLKTISATAKPLCPRIGADVPGGRSGIYRTRKTPLFRRT